MEKYSAKENNPILEYLRKYNYDNKAAYSISSSAMDHFSRSCAGYTVISYILAFGDRHLDNLLLHKSGKFFHIDYGFIFGMDPKPFTPLVRFTKEMLFALGGMDSFYYNQFIQYVVKSYLCLRKSYLVIINLIRTMFDVDLTDLSIRQTPEAAINTVLDRFKLNLSDQEAQEYIIKTVLDSSIAVIPVVMEQMHKIAVSFR